MADKPLKNDAIPPSDYAQAIPVDQYGRPVQTDGGFQQQQQQYTMVAPPQVIPSNSAIQRDAQGNALCKKCNAPYPLPPGCTSWRCRSCHELNNASVYGDECPCCTIA